MAKCSRAHSIEPAGYILPIHPDERFSDCRRYEQPASRGSISGMRFADCYAVLSRWFPGWVPRVRTASVRLPACEYRAVPVKLRRYRVSWWLWWFPNPHVGGSQRDHFLLETTIDSSRCERPL
jgi:hypothetical protein